MTPKTLKLLTKSLRYEKHAYEADIQTRAAYLAVCRDVRRWIDEFERKAKEEQK